jgi:hypothetical protein
MVLISTIAAKGILASRLCAMLSVVTTNAEDSITFQAGIIRNILAVATVRMETLVALFYFVAGFTGGLVTGAAV